MALKYMQGFETVIDDSDIRTQGWWVNATTYLGTTGMPAKGQSGPAAAAGNAMYQFSAQGSWAGAITEGAAATAHLGFIAPGQTLNQLWAAGGFVMGMNLKFNEGMNGFSDGQTGGQQTANGIYGTFCQVANDGTNYYAIRLVGSSYLIQKSSDFKTWTTISPPAGFVIGVQTTIACPEPGMVWLGGAAVSSTAHWYTTNDGAAWTQGTNVTNVTGWTGVVKLTGSSYNYALAANSSVNTANGIYVCTALNGTFTKLTGTLSAASQFAKIKAFPTADKVVGVCSSATNSQIVFSFKMSTAAPNAVTTANFGGAYDVEYFNGNWYVAAASSVQYQADSSNGPTTTGWTAATGPGGTNCLQVVGSRLYAMGLANAIWYTDDGTTWTKLTLPRTIPSYSSGLVNSWITCTKGADGKYRLVSTGNFVLETTNFTDWKFISVIDGATEVAAVNTAIAGLYIATTYNATAGSFTQATNGRLGIYASALSGSSGAYYRTITLNSTSTAIGTYNVPVSLDTGLSPWHYYEIVAVADNATTNNFYLTLKIDGIPVIGPTVISYPLGTNASDTTSVVLLSPLSRTGQFTAVDDLYFLDASGTTNKGAIGPAKIIRRPATTDIQAQWTKVGSQSTNSASVKKDSISSTANTDYVTTTTTGATDIYAPPTTLPSALAGYSARAVNVSGYFSRLSATVPSIQLGLKSGSASGTGSAVNISSGTPTYLSQFFELDPNGSANWTLTSALNANMTVTKSGP